MLIETTDVSRVFRVGSNEIVALHDVSISIPERKLTVLRGPSGSGKTTLINLLGGLDKPTTGKIVIGDEVISELSNAQKDEYRRRNIGFVFQSVALMGHMTAAENIDFGLRLAGFPRKERAERVQACLKMVGLGEKGKHYPAELSGGEQQRIAIARAIASKPRVLFADEPTAQLDTNMGLHIVKLFRTLIEEQGLTIVMTTHDTDIMEIADQVFTLRDGAVVDQE